MAHIRVGCISYLNSLPFFWRLDGAPFELVDGSPRHLFELFRRGEIDAGLLPTGGILALNDSSVTKLPLGIAVQQRAISVKLYSNAPVERLSGARIGVTEHTLSSAKLLKILVNELWRLEGIKYVSLQNEQDAVLLIGDAALKASKEQQYAHEYDLGAEWHRMTGLPFVFAQWVINANVAKQHMDELERRLRSGLENALSRTDELVRDARMEFMTQGEKADYIRNFSYTLGEAEMRAVDKYAYYLNKIGELRANV